MKTNLFIPMAAIVLSSQLSLAGSLLRTTQTLQLHDLPRMMVSSDLGNIEVTSNDELESARVTAVLVSNDQSKLDGLANAWTIGVQDNNGVLTLSRKNRGGMASYSCSITRIFSKMSVSGACYEKIVVEIPSRVAARQIDQKTIAFSVDAGRPGHGHHGGDNRPDPFAPKVIEQAQVELLKANYKSATFSSDKDTVLKNFAAMLKTQGYVISATSLVSITQLETFDSDRLEILEFFIDVLQNKDEVYKAMLNNLTWDSSKSDLAQKIYNR